jgi:hypothetical protein
MDNLYRLFSFLFTLMVWGLASQGYPQSFYPDEFGNTWVLRSTDGIDLRTVTIEGPEMIEGESLKVIKDQTNENVSRLFVKIEPDGVKLFRTMTTLALLGEIVFDYSPPQVFIPNPLNLGSEWTVISEAQIPLVGDIRVTNRARVVAIEDVAAPAGTFRNSLKIETDIIIGLPIGDILQSSVMWLAPEIGLVKAIDTNDIVFELINYRVTTIEEPPIAVQPKGNLATTWAALKR